MFVLLADNVDKDVLETALADPPLLDQQGLLVLLHQLEDLADLQVLAGQDEVQVAIHPVEQF